MRKGGRNNLFTTDSSNWYPFTTNSSQQWLGIGSLVLHNGSRSVFIGLVHAGCMSGSQLVDGKVLLWFYCRYSGKSTWLYKTGSKVIKKLSCHRKLVIKLRIVETRTQNIREQKGTWVMTIKKDNRISNSKTKRVRNVLCMEDTRFWSISQSALGCVLLFFDTVIRKILDY